MSNMSVVVSGNTVHIQNSNNGQVYTSLQVGTYVVKIDPRGNFYLEKTENFTNPSKMYGDVHKRTERVIKTFEERTTQTGVLLSGEKGSGKTLLARQISIDCLAKGIPTIIVSEPFCGSTFSQFIQTIQQEVVVLFDEFEKIYEDEDQEKILSLFDGVFQTKKLFIVTVNDEGKMTYALKNRPGRLYYRFNYSGMNEDFIKEYCEDKEFPLLKTEQLTKLSRLFYSFNFDMLKAFVEECTRYDEMPITVMDYINANPSEGYRSEYVITLIEKESGKKLKTCRPSMKFDVTNMDSSIDYRNDDGEYEGSIYFRKGDFKQILDGGRCVVFENEEHILNLVKKEESLFKIDPNLL